MTALSLFLALAMIFGPIAWALVRCGALADRRSEVLMRDREREQQRDAMRRPLPQARDPYRLGGAR